MRLRVVVLCMCLAMPAFPVCAASQALAPRDQAPAENRPTLWIIPHTHWEGAVFETREEYLEDDLPNILEALQLLRTFPEYTFVLDQVAYVKPFLERYPEEAAEFRKFVAEGRLQIVGGNDVMLDVNIPSGESWIRQVLYGKGYYRQALNVDVTTGWALDTFGHHDQMPQLLKLAGYTSYWFQRGVHDAQSPSEFSWQGLDGSRIPAFWLPLGYGLFYRVPKNLYEFDAYVPKVWASLGKSSRFENRVALAGADVVKPEPELPEMLRAYDAQPNTPFALRFGVPTEYAQIVARRSDQPVVRGELNPVFQGTYSNRIELKQWMREDERILTSSEKLAALGEIFGLPPNLEQRWQAWEPVLFNEAHDLTSGTMVDKVYRETIQSYQSSRDLGNAMVRSSLDSIGAKIDTTNGEKNAIPILIFNTLGWRRTDIAQTELRFDQPGVKEIKLEGPEGEEEPVQLLHTERDGGGDIRSTTVAFIAHDVPAMGWSTYYAVPRGQQPTEALSANAGSPLYGPATDVTDSVSLENKFYRATFNMWTGAMTGLELKSPAGDWQVLGKDPGNVVACEQDGGDSWELFGDLNGARFTAMNRPSGLPEHDRSHFSNEWVGPGDASIGPVFSEFEVGHPFGENNFSTRVRIYSGIQRIDFETKITNNDKFVRYRLLFPTTIPTGRRVDEIPFGSLERPERHELPAQNWTDWSDGKHGVALLNIGLPGTNVADGTLLLSLMRSAEINSYELPEGGSPPSSELGLELGQQRIFHYALVPHSGSWQDARIPQAGLEFNNPLLVQAIEQHPGSLAKKWGLLEISDANVVLSALGPAQDGHGIILRVYEAAGQPAANVAIHFAPGISAASEVNLMEDPLQSISVENNSIHFDLRPFEIKTFRLQQAAPVK